jgi:hypothetical protein
MHDSSLRVDGVNMHMSTHHFDLKDELSDGGLFQLNVLPSMFVYRLFGLSERTLT